METQELLKETYASGLNIYALLNKFKKEMMYPMPENIIKLVCEEYLLNKPKIIHSWPWFASVIKRKRDEVYAQSQIKEHQESAKHTNTKLLRDIFGGK